MVKRVDKCTILLLATFILGLQVPPTAAQWRTGGSPSDNAPAMNGGFNGGGVPNGAPSPNGPPRGHYGGASGYVPGPRNFNNPYVPYSPQYPYHPLSQPPYWGQGQPAPLYPYHIDPRSPAPYPFEGAFVPRERQPLSPIERSYRELQMSPVVHDLAGVPESPKGLNKDDPAAPERSLKQRSRRDESSQDAFRRDILGRQRGDSMSDPESDPSGVPDDVLRQFGYSLFNAPVNSISTFAPVEDVPVGPDYLLGPGDNLRIHVWGAMESAITGTVDRNGVIFLPTAGPVRVWGLTFTQAEKIIRDQLSRYYRGFETSVTMGRLRTIRVYVVGETAQPGAYTVSSLATLVNALFAAGGPKKVGSLRTLLLKRNHHTVGTFDLYDFLLRGDKTRDFRLESGDTIFVPPVGPTAGIVGEVKRPAIYELSESTRITDLIEMAGGLTPRSYLKRVQLIRTKPNAEREVIDLDFTATNGSSPANFELRNGDLVRIHRTDPRIYNTVTLNGSVKYPGEYQFKVGMRIADVVPQGSTYPEAFLENIEVARLHPDLSTSILQLDLRKSWRGDPEHNVELREGDVISIRSRTLHKALVTLSGQVERPGRYVVTAGERLSSVLERAGGFTEFAYPYGSIFTRRSVADREEERLDRFMQEQEGLLLVGAGANKTLKPLSAEEEKGRMLVIEQKRQLLKATAQRVVLGRIVINLSNNVEAFKGSVGDVELQDGDKLYIPRRPVSVMVLGGVRNPTAVLFKEDEDVEYYVNRAGGFSEIASKKEMYLLKADGSAITGFLRLRNIHPGDAVIVPPKTQKKDLTWVADVAKIAGQAALGLAALVSIAR